MSEIPRKYIEKPAIVEAIQFTEENRESAMAFVGRFPVPIGKAGVVVYHDARWNEETEEIAWLGDYIVKDAAGDCHAVKAKVFEATHEELTS